MARSKNQKLKLLYLMQFLQRQSDELHPQSMDAIIAALAAKGIQAERKSVYDDIDALKSFGMDILLTKSKPGGYYLVSRSFELPELMLLVDSVQSSQFITEKKSRQLINKLAELCSAHEAQLVQWQIHVLGRIKHMNESIYYNVDAIHNGIAKDLMIRFRYFEYTVDKKKCYRHGDQLYLVSPYALTWNNENYYLIAYDGAAGILKHYRVDRMEEITATELPREGKEIFEAHDMNRYMRSSFSMFGGEERNVDLLFQNALMGVVIDRFGKDIAITKVDAEHFCIHASVMVSPQFYAWVFGLGAGARILGPKDVVDGMTAQLNAVQAGYSQITP